LLPPSLPTIARSRLEEIEHAFAEQAEQHLADEPAAAADYAAERDRCTHSFRAFVRAAWRHVEPRPLVWGWHLEAMIEALESVTRGQIRRLVINVPPGSSKTLLVQVLWPAWEWICDQHPRSDAFPDGYRPDLKYIFATYSDKLALDKSLKCRRLVESVWYQTLFAERWSRDPVQWSASKFQNDRGGWRLATSVGGQGTGQHADRKVVDDPLKPQDVLGGSQRAHKVALENAWTWWTQTMSTRNTGAETAEIVIMQRLHHMDLAGRLIAAGGYEVLCIPQQYEPQHPFQRPLVLERDEDGEPVRVWHDPRSEVGELMCPERFSAAECAKRKRDLGDQGYAAQEQQRPSPAAGGIYKRADFQFWTIRPHGGIWMMSCDCTFKDVNTADYVVLQVWCALGANFYLIDQVRERLDVLATCQAITTLRAKWRDIGTVLVEDKANGPAVITILKNTVPGIQPVTPEGGKESRANATASYHRAGNVHLPDPSIAPWVHDYIEEHTSFPFAAHDDQVDAQSQALTHLASQVTQFEKMLATMRQLGVS
jgi:predicted phage terminase large subunit-like protein